MSEPAEIRKDASEKLVGAMAAIQKRVLREYTHDEFNPPRVAFSATEIVRPSPYGLGRRNILEVRIATSFAIFEGAPDEAYEMAERNALREMAACLYEDVLRDLRGIMRAIGDGHRGLAMTAANDLYRRLLSDEKLP